MECTLPLYGIDQRLNCIFLRFSANNELDNTPEQPNGRVDRTLSVGERVGIQRLSAVKCVLPVISFNLALQPFSPPLSRPDPRFYISIVFIDLVESSDRTSFRFLFGKLVS